MLNAAASQAGKRAGQQLALDVSGEWPEIVLAELRAWLEDHRAQGNATMTMEQFRVQAVNQPASFKAWGALPRLACAAGLLEALTHDDGSPVARPAESVRTHGHFVRVWKIVPASSSIDGDNSPTLTLAEGSQARRHPNDIEAGGAVLHAGGGAELLRATAEYHRTRGLGDGA